MYKIQSEDIAKAAIILSHAFNNYPIFEYVIPDSSYRSSHLKYLCQFLLRLGMFKGEVIAPSDALEGVSIWLPSNGSKNLAIDAIRAGLPNLFFQIDIQTFRRFMAIGSVKGRERKAVVKGPYNLCDMIGVNPLFQRRGFGRIMLETKLTECDKIRIPCYLETSDFNNIKYYEQFGFALMHKYNIQDVNVYCLLRESSPVTLT